MMMKTLTFLFFLCFTNVLFAQNTFQKSITPLLDTTLLRCAPDGKAVYLVGQVRENGNLHIHYLKIDNTGNLLWQKEYKDLFSGYRLQSMTLQKDGLLILLSDVSAAILVKINLNDGTTTWIKYYGKNERIHLYNVALDGYDQIWLSGLHLQSINTDSNYYFQIKADKDAKPLKATQARTAYSSVYYKDIQYFKPSKAFWLPSKKSMVMFADYTAPYSKRMYFQEYNKTRELIFGDQNMEYTKRDLDSDFSDLFTAKKYVIFSATSLKYTGTFITPSKDYLYGIMDSTAFFYLKVNGTDSPMTPLHNNDGSIVFYSNKYRTLTKFDENLKEIWTRKYDNCLSTTAFAGDIAADGSIFTVRNLIDRTVVSHINSDGSLPACIDYPTATTPFVVDERYNKGVTYENCNCLPYSIPVVKDTLISVNSKSTALVDICIKIDASFKTPDTFCLGRKFNVVGVDTNFALKHIWRFQAQMQEIYNPSFVFDVLGLKKVFHQEDIKNCRDTASNYVFVMAEPIIAIKDTVVCAQKSIQINLSSKYGQLYYLNNQKTSPLVSINQSGTYTFKINTNGCNIEQKASIKLVDFERPIFKQDSVTCLGNPYPVVFEKRFKEVFWDNQKVTNDTFWIKDAGVHRYNITYSLDTLCKISGTLKIDRKACDDIFVPNAFSPNGDLVNDEFRAFALPSQKILGFSIYDRWGSLVFQASDATSTWDGTFRGQPCPQGIYTYFVQYLDLKSMKQKSNSGDVMIVP
jgi:gliding motility-associated-like protein